MRRLVGTIAVALAGLLTHAAGTWGQHDHSSGQAQGHQAAQACAIEFEKVVGEGRGFGMAFAADQNGYPRPHARARTEGPAHTSRRAIS